MRTLEQDRLRKKRQRDANLESARQKQRAYDEANPERSMLTRARRRAKLKGVPFNLTLEDIVIPDRCPILDIPFCLTLGHGRGGQDGTPSLDRIVPELGYTRGNIAVVSYRANRIKNDASIRDVRKLLEWMERHAGDPTVP